MSFYNQQIDALREALASSPDNLPLRQLLGETLYQAGRHQEAEAELRRALALAPVSSRTRLALAETFSAQQKHGEALVLVEEILKGPDRPARALLLHARLSLKSGAIDQARRSYEQAIAQDPGLSDPTLVEQFPAYVPAADPAADQYPQPFADDEDECDEVVDDRIRLRGQDTPDDARVEIERPKLCFSDVGGMDPLKEEIRLKIIYPLTHREMFAAYGKKIGGGILLFGPPGCGKTYLARATAGEVKAFFLSVGIHEVVNMWLGESERNLHGIFEQARSHHPCVLFFDEVDAIGASRTDMRYSAGRLLINQFLSELDGVEAANDGVLILGATNAPWHLDPAFRRPGRFDRIIFVPPPDMPAREAILRLQCRGKPAQDVDFERLAKKTDGFSGADLKAVVDVTIEEKLKDAMKTGLPKPMTTRDLLAAVGNVKPSTKEWFASARNYALFSNQGGVYDDILKFLKT